LADAAVARMYLSVFRERNALLPFLFHSLFRDENEVKQNAVDPLERTMVEQFRQLVEYYVEHGYRFVGPEDLLAGLDPGKKYAMLTFDDGYYNNVLALPVLEQFKVPALFFISTNHVRENKCFWWDVYYRESLARGVKEREAYYGALAMKGKKTEEIESELAERFGADVLRPRGDIDRPFTPAELKEFARHPWVRLGNHTANHAILTNYSDEEIYAQVKQAQDDLEAMTGVRAAAIAYPNGGHDQRVVNICEKAGLTMGFTVRPAKTKLPLAQRPGALMRLGRFVPHAEAPMTSQCRTYRSDWLMYGAFRDYYLKMVRGQVAQ
jgi:peptidoglycan/xylan/chitin deacetylase (PgdA/CDA1 family)